MVYVYVYGEEPSSINTSRLPVVQSSSLSDNSSNFFSVQRINDFPDSRSYHEVFLLSRVNDN